MSAAIGRRKARLLAAWFVGLSLCTGAVVSHPALALARPFPFHRLHPSMYRAPDISMTAAGDTPLGNEFRVSATTDLPDGEPSVVFNSVRNEYLVVWSTLYLGRYIINAQRVGIDGHLAGGPITVAGGADADRTQPDVAYNAQLDRYLVVWQANDGLSSRIFGRFLSGIGIGLGDEIAISSGSALKDCHAPSVAYGQSADRYVVVWDRMISGGLSSDLEAQTYSGSSGAPNGNNYLLKEGTAPIGYFRPDLAYNEERDEFLLVWEQLLRSGSGDITDIYAHLLQGTGTAVSGDDIELARLTSSNYRPSVAAIPFLGVGQYLVAWELAYAATDRDIFARIVTGEGVATPTLIDVSRASVDESAPSVAGSRDRQSYFVAWTSTAIPPVINSNIYGAMVDVDSKVVSPAASIGAVSAGGAAVAAGSTGDFIAVFDDMPLGADRDIYGRLWGDRLYLPFLGNNG